MKTNITQSLLKESLHYDPNTGVFTWLRKPNRNWPSERGNAAGCVKKSTGYVYITLFGKCYLAHRLAWLYIYGEFPTKDIDHVNRCRRDNRINNLRVATESENGYNSIIPSRNTSGIKGVVWHKQRRRWMAQCTVNGKNIYLGIFSNIEKAAEVRKEFASTHHGFFYNDGAAQ